MTLTDNMWSVLERAEQFTGGDYDGMCALTSADGVGLRALANRGLVKSIGLGHYEEDPENREREIFAITDAGKALMEERG